MLNLDQTQFEMVRPITWSEVFASWQVDEAGQPRWIEHYTRRGFTSWEAWRQQHIAPLKLDQREWRLYRILQPQQSVPRFYGGPFKSWKQEHYEEKETLTFAELATRPKIESDEVINALASNFPSSTTLIGLWQQARVVIVEGMHRCCALALAERRSQHVEVEIAIALTDFSGEAIPLLASAKNV